MADKAVNFFNPSNVLSLANGWVQQSDGIVSAVQRAQGIDAVGDEAASKLYGGGSAGPVVYDNFVETGNLVLPKVGIIAGGFHLDNWTLTYNANGWPRLVCNVHQHDTNPHTTGLEAFTSSAATTGMPAQFGIPRSWGGFALTASDCGISALSLTMGCTHLDEDENGEHLAGDNRDGVETCAAAFTGAPTVTDPAGWDELTDGDPIRSNIAAETASMSWENHVARD